MKNKSGVTDKESRITVSGFLRIRRVRLSLLAGTFVCLAVSLVGSCNTSRYDMSGAAFAAAGKPSLMNLTPDERNRYARALQWKLADNPDSLIRLAGVEVEMALAGPDLRRSDLPTVVWQYKMPSCVLDLYFRADASGRADSGRLIHYEIRTPQGEQADRKACMASLFRDRRPEPSKVSLAGG